MLLATTLIKPHLVFLLPIVLLAKGSWRTLMSLTLTTSAILAATTVALGFDAWSDWLRLVFSQGYGVAVHEGQAWKSASLTGLLGSITGSGTLWTGVTALLIAAAAMVTWLVVTRTGASLSTAWAWAMTAGIVAAPHAMIYDVVVLLPLVFALSVQAWTPTTRVLLLLWTLAMFMVAPLFALRSALDLPAFVSAPWHVLITCALGYVLARCLRLRSLQSADS